MSGHLTEPLVAGIHYDVASELYHTDPCEQPSLSASLAHLLCSKSPAHARAAHPRLNPVAVVRQDEHHFDIGTAVHALLLEGRIAVEVVEGFDDWKKQAARDARDAAREAGKIPLLAKHWDEVSLMVAGAREQLEAYEIDPAALSAGRPEATLVWEEGGGTCRARLDWLREDYLAIDDVKTTARGASPDTFSRNTIYEHGYDVKAAFYLRGVKALTGVEAEFRWIALESTPPYVLSVNAPGPDVLAHGESKVEYALSVWKRCIASGEWPGYTNRVAYAELPAWEDSRWMEKAEREGFAA